MKQTRIREYVWAIVIPGVFLGCLALLNDAESQSIIRSNFDHDTTAFRLEGSHIVTSCASCHKSGVFSGTPIQCNGCHTSGGRIAATFKPARHIFVSQQCSSCHNTNSWSPVLRVDHIEVLGTCSSCHNNRIVAGQPPDHIPTTAECDTCHNTVDWDFL